MSVFSCFKDVQKPISFSPAPYCIDAPLLSRLRFMKVRVLLDEHYRTTVIEAEVLGRRFELFNEHWKIAFRITCDHCLPISVRNISVN